MKRKSKFYVVPIFDCVEPESLIGPFKTFEGMRKRAVKVRQDQSDADAIFWLEVTGGLIKMHPFTNDDLEIVNL